MPATEVAKDRQQKGAIWSPNPVFGGTREADKGDSNMVVRPEGRTPIFRHRFWVTVCIFMVIPACVGVSIILGTLNGSESCVRFTVPSKSVGMEYSLRGGCNKLPVDEAFEKRVVS